MVTINTIIQAEGLFKRYSKLTAVDGVSFQVKEGEMFGFLGPNGAGKTTTMKMIQCVSPKTSGKLEVFGMDVSAHQREIKKYMGIVPQENNLDPDFTVYENLRNYSRYFDIPPIEADKRIEELLDFVQLRDKKNSMPESLSGGMKRRLVLARALLNKPSLIILDEPTVGLDPQARHLIWDKLRFLKKSGVTIVLTTHYLDEAEKLCDRLVVMDYGKIIVEGEPGQIINDHIGSGVVEVNNHSEIVECLQKSDSSYEVMGDIIVIYTNDPTHITDQLSKECSLDKMTTRKATLEDVFLKLTGRKLRE
ncbi:ABC-type multidrug transport system, ATPase component [Methanomethylovorans hollandica DSM 15978]|uniref:ABC-type multidrug transport system, ATPase component n=1 Tax=Methanomethylovorans hollandica (strain DSM 15978 / NBRC 107637 / DMS1) TaxID=867904 RepID=L0KUN9_METHD|nr:ABC transporter ATP-binding protein [Methanomethylovorans hollandica]AGB48400.1 ABC-type multidrug transport system, ATPase component [Methanomethylovorans hollandica DSM 15978]